MQKITPFFWFDKNMSGILEYYQNIFQANLEIINRNKLAETPSGDVEIVEVQLFGNRYTFMTAGPTFKFNEAISLVISCDGQEEVDSYWDFFTKEGRESQCGWCKDKYGLSWQIVPTQLQVALGNPDRELASFAQAQMMQMKKIIIKDLIK
jgi:predicted 3-demethylubiquinone-9 3-methyltransferase (glyoxalase superfamily)